MKYKKGQTVTARFNNGAGIKKGEIFIIASVKKCNSYPEIGEKYVCCKECGGCYLNLIAFKGKSPSDTCFGIINKGYLFKSIADTLKTLIEQ